MVTAPFISEKLITAALEDLNVASPEEAAARQKRCGRLQPELTAFVAAFTLEGRPAAAGVGLFVMLVLYEAFAAGAVKTRKARDRVVLKHWRAARDHTAALRLKVDDPFDLLNDLPDSSEPAALQYVIDALAEAADEEDVRLTDDEFWKLYMVLRATIETLHEVATPRPA